MWMITGMTEDMSEATWTMNPKTETAGLEGLCLWEIITLKS
jgi:hypothetical protein